MTKNYLPQIQVLRTLADMQSINLQDGISVLVAEDLTVYQISSVTRAGAITLDNGKFAIPTLIGGSGTQSNADFLKQAKAVGLAENDLEDVELFKLGEKVENTDPWLDLLKSLKRTRVESNSQSIDFNSISSGRIYAVYIVAEGDNIVQPLPDVSSNKEIVIQIEKQSDSVQNYSITFQAKSGELIEEGSLGMESRLFTNEFGMIGRLVPLISDNVWEFEHLYHSENPKSDIEFVGVDGKVISGNKLTSNDGSVRYFLNLDGSVDLSIYDSEMAEGIFAKLEYDQIINIDISSARPYFRPLYSKTGNILGIDLDRKGYTGQEGDNLDPVTSDGQQIEIGMYINPLDEVRTTDAGYVELKLVNSITGDYILDVMGNPISSRIEYANNQIIKKQYVINKFVVKGQVPFALEFSTNFKSDVIRLSGDSCIYIQAGDIGMAKLLWERETGITVRETKRYLGTNFMDLQQIIGKDIPEDDMPDGNQMIDNGIILSVIDTLKYKIENKTLYLLGNKVNKPIFCIGKIVDPIDTYLTRGKNYAVKITLIDKEVPLAYSMLEWTGEGKANTTILTGYAQDGTPTFSAGYKVIGTKNISIDAVSGEYIDTNAFTVPQDAKQVVVVLYPTNPTEDFGMFLKNMQIDVIPSFTRTILSNNSGIVELNLEKGKYTYRSVAYTPKGTGGIRFTINNYATKVPIGIVSGGDGKIINDNSWFDVGSNYKEIQGDFKFLSDGKARFSYSARIFDEMSGTDTVEFWLVKVNDDGTFTEVPNSRYTNTITQNTKVPVIINKEAFEFTVKKNESYRMLAKSNKVDGFYLQSNTDGVPLYEAIISFTEIEETSQELLDMIADAKEITIVDDSGKEITNKRIEINAKTGQLKVVDK